MDLDFQTFKEFVAQRGSESEDDEVFIAGKCSKIRYARRKTEQFDPDFRTNRQSVIPSEDYFADMSRLSTEASEIDLRGLGQPSDSHVGEDHGASPQNINLLANQEDELVSDFPLDERNISFRLSGRLSSAVARPVPLLSFQQFSSGDLVSSGSSDDLKSIKTGGESAESCRDAVFNQSTVENKSQELAADQECRTSSVHQSVDEIQREHHGLTVDPSSRSPDVTVSHLDLVDRTSESNRLHDSAFPTSVDDSLFGGEKDELSLASGSSRYFLRDSAFGPSNDPGPGTSCLSVLSSSVNVQCEVPSKTNIVACSEAPVDEILSWKRSIVSSEVPPIISALETSEVASERQIGHQEFRVRSAQNENYFTGHRASDVPLADVCLPSILVDHFENCLADEEKIAVDNPALKENTLERMASLDNSWNYPGCSGVPFLRLSTETSDQMFHSDSDSDCDTSLEALRRWNQHLMDNDRKAKEIAAHLRSGSVVHNLPLHAKAPSPDPTAQSSSEQEKRSAGNGPSSVAATTTRTLFESRERSKASTRRTSRLEFELDLQIGRGSSPDRRPSPMVSALQLTPTRLREQAEPSPSTLECLDLSVDDRIPVGRYFTVMDKENWNLEAKTLPEKKKTPTTKPGSIPMREILNCPTIKKSPDSARFAAPKPLPPTKAGAKKTGIPVIESKMEGSRHARCFNLYSTNRLQELKSKSMKDFQHVSSPVGEYIREFPVSPFIQNVRPKVLAFQKAEKFVPPVKTFFPTPLSHLPVARYKETNIVPSTLEPPARKYKYFPSPRTPIVIKHTGPSHVILDASCLHEELVGSSGHKASRIPYFKDARATGDESLWEIVSPKTAGKK